LHTEETLLLRLLKHLCLGKRETGVRHDDLLCQLQDVQTLLEIGGLFEVALRERGEKKKKIFHEGTLATRTSRSSLSRRLKQPMRYLKRISELGRPARSISSWSTMSFVTRAEDVSVSIMFLKSLAIPGNSVEPLVLSLASTVT